MTPNGPDRNNLYIQAQKMAIQNVAFIPIGQVVLTWRWKSSIQGLALGSGFNYPDRLRAMTGRTLACRSRA